MAGPQLHCPRNQLANELAHVQGDRYRWLLESDDPQEALAELNRWNLVERNVVAGTPDRTTMLRPVVAFVQHRGTEQGDAAYAA